MKGLVGTLGLPALMSGAGIWLVGQIAKFIPVIGTVAGAMISGTVAASLTAALGYAASESCYHVSLSVIDGDERGIVQAMENMGNVFKKAFNEKYS